MRSASRGLITAGRSRLSSKAAQAASSSMNHRRSASTCSAALLALSRMNAVTVVLVAFAANRISVFCRAFARRLSLVSRASCASCSGLASSLPMTCSSRLCRVSVHTLCVHVKRFVHPTYVQNLLAPLALQAGTTPTGRLACLAPCPGRVDPARCRFARRRGRERESPDAGGLLVLGDAELQHPRLPRLDRGRID